MLFRVHGLKTLLHMFPNLTVIRGQSYLAHFSLILYEMLDMEEVSIACTYIYNQIYYTKNL